MLSLYNKGKLNAEEAASQVYTWIHTIPELWELIPAESDVRKCLVVLENGAIQEGVDLLLITRIAIVKHVNGQMTSRIEIDSFGSVSLLVRDGSGSYIEYQAKGRLSDFANLRMHDGENLQRRGWRIR